MLFDQVVRRGSVSGAARAAHLSQPAVTQAVAQVEAALGARLLHRSYSGLELTGAVTIKRLDFGVGQGEWKSTESVGDAVKITYKVILTKAG